MERNILNSGLPVIETTTIIISIMWLLLQLSIDFNGDYSNTEEEGKEVEIVEEIKSSDVIFYIYLILDNINIAKLSEIWLVYLIQMNVDFDSILLFLFLSIFERSIKRNTNIKDFGVFMLIWKWIQVGVFIAGVYMISHISEYNGEESPSAKTKMLSSIGLLCFSEILNSTFLKNSVEKEGVTIYFEKIGNYVMIAMIVYYNWLGFDAYLYFFHVSVVSSLIGLIFLTLFWVKKVFTK
jgi:hypothetical protein